MDNFKFSVVVPVYNRPAEVDELLDSLTRQSVKNFEVIIVEDGSTEKSDKLVNKYQQKLHLQYFFKNNEGPGLTRNYGAQRARGKIIVFFDSDCIVPEKYFELVTAALAKKTLDAYGGPDMAHPSFTKVQKAINYSMTSFFTTGGIRGASQKMDKFHPRSFNMGYTQEVFNKTGGFGEMRFGEDIDMSYRILENKFTTGLIPEAAVYHKRRTNFRQFFKQVFNSGVARINLSLRHPGTFKVVHLLPASFVLFELLCVIAATVIHPYVLLLLLVPAVAFFTDSLVKNKSLMVALLSVVAGFGQLNGYGLGFLKAFWKRIVRRQPEFHSFKMNFYK